MSAETGEAGGQASEEVLAINEENFPDEGMRKQVKLAPGMPEADLKVSYTVQAVGGSVIGRKLEMGIRRQ